MLAAVFFKRSLGAGADGQICAFAGELLTDGTPQPLASRRHIGDAAPKP
jgi:hypothetical protein